MGSLLSLRRMAPTCAVLLSLTAACSADGPATVEVTIESFKFAPDPVTISVGDSVTWTNADPVGHNAQASDKSFRTPLFFSGESATATFDTAGTFPYFCGAHPEMVGTVIVEPEASG